MKVMIEKTVEKLMKLVENKVMKVVEKTECYVDSVII